MVNWITVFAGIILKIISWERIFVTHWFCSYQEKIVSHSIEYTREALNKFIRHESINFLKNEITKFLVINLEILLSRLNFNNIFTTLLTINEKDMFWNDKYKTVARSELHWEKKSLSTTVISVPLTYTKCRHDSILQYHL